MCLKGKSQKFTQNFLVAPALHPILGADFMHKHHVTLDVPRQGLTVQGCFIQGTSITGNSFCNSVTTDSVMCVSHSIQLTGTPKPQRYRPLLGNKLDEVRNQIKSLLNQGVIRRSCSSFASPIHLVSKKNGSWRMVGDYRLLNELTEPDRYPLPRINDILNNLHDAKYFSTLDIDKAYHQIPMNDDDIPKTAIITPIGLFEYLKMPFGLKNAGSTFQRHMDSIFSDLEGVFVYMDDILVTGKTQAEHDKRLITVQSLLKKHNLSVNDTKCVFNKLEVLFLGHKISLNCIKPLKDKLAAIENLPLPNTIREVRRLLGMINFYHNMIPNCSQLTYPISNLLKGKKKVVVWSEEALQSFEKIKSLLSSEICVAPPNYNHPFVLTTDASGHALGGVLKQFYNDRQYNVAYHSRTFNSHEVKYSTFDRELLAIFDSINHFKHLIDGAKLHVETDHKPLVYAFQMKSPSPRQFRQLSLISLYTNDIRYIPGEDNVTADLLSRPTTASVLQPLNFDDIISLQRNDETLENLDNTDIQLTLKKGVLYDTSTNNLRLLLPTTKRYEVFQHVHNIAHISNHRTFEQIREKYVWPGMRSDIGQWCRSCSVCQQSKITVHTKAPFVKISSLISIQYYPYGFGWSSSHFFRT